MLADYAAVVFLLLNVPNIIIETLESNEIPEADMGPWIECEEKCGGQVAYEERQRAGLDACYTHESEPDDMRYFKYASDGCVTECMGDDKPDDDQLQCFYDMCTKDHTYKVFCAGYAQKAIEKHECDLILSGKVRHFFNCTK